MEEKRTPRRKKKANTEQKDQIIKVKINKRQPRNNSLFSKREIRKYVTEFVASWVRGDIIIRFPTAAELSKKNPLSISFPQDPSVNQELKIKEHYVDLLSICAGIKEATTQEREKAISDTFKILLMFRSANRIEGKIISNDLEHRVSKLEETTKTNSKLLEQITGHLFSEKKKTTKTKTKTEG